MINVNQITSRLASMPDQALQQYAAMHKNDPYVMALALSESNRRKQMRQGAQMQAPQQPKVVDQEIAGMAQPMPEDVGIGQLPAQNMQRMAEGGIVAFEEGGDVPRFYDGVFVGQGFNQNPLVPPPTQNRNALMANKITDIAAQAEQDELSKIDAALQTTPPGQQRSFLENRKRILLSGKSSTPAPAPAATATAATFDDMYKKPAPTASTFDDMYKNPAVRNMPTAVPPRPAPPKETPPPAAPAAVKPTGIAALPTLNTTAKTAAEAKAEAATLSDDAELRNKLEANETFTTQAYDKLLGDYTRKISEMPEAYKGYEERLKKEEAEASTDKNKALGMAIFQAGLGMMAGTSQYAFENISKGALSGLDNYQSALKDLKKAQRERDKAFADIEAARLAEKRGDIKAQTELQAKGIDALGMAKNRTVEGIAKIFDVDTRTATGIFETSLKDKAQNERTIYSGAIDLQKQREADAASMARTNAQVAGAERVAKTNADTYKLPMLYKSVEDSVDKMLLADTNYKLADEATKTRRRDEELRKRLLATPGLAQYAPAASGGGGGNADFVYENGQLVPRKP
jgi:hypothetical protein